MKVTEGNSQITNRLTLNGGAIIASGSGTSFTGVAPVEVYGNLAAINGGTLELPGASRIVASQGAIYTFQATGARSRMALPNLTELNAWSLELVADGAGAIVSMPNVAALPPGTNVYLSNGGQLQTQPITTLDQVSLHFDGPGNYEFPASLETFARGRLSISGSAIVPLNRLVRLDGAALAVNGPAPNLATLTDVNRSEFSAENGALIELSGVTSYVGYSGFERIFSAVGNGSRLSFENLTHFHDAALFLRADGAGARVSMPRVEELPARTIELGHGGDLDVPLISSLQGVTLLITAAEPTFISQLRSLTDARIIAYDRSVLTFGSLETLGAVQIWADSDSRVDLTQMKELADDGNSYRSFWATGGGEVLLPNLGLTQSRGLDVRVEGAGSVVDLSSLQVGQLSMAITLGDGGNLVMPHVTSLDGDTLEVFGEADAPFCRQLNSLTNGRLSIRNNRTLNLSSIGNIDNSVVIAKDGGIVVLPAVKETRWNREFVEHTYIAEGPGSLISLPQLAKIDSSSTTLRAIGDGATISLPSLQDVSPIDEIIAEGAGALVELPLISGFEHGTSLSLLGGGDIFAPQVTEFRGGTIRIAATPENRFVRQLTSVTEATLELYSPAAVTLPQLTNINGTTLVVSGAEVELPGVESIHSQDGMASGLAVFGRLALPALKSATASPFVIRTLFDARLDAPVLSITSPCSVEVEAYSELRVGSMSLGDDDWLRIHHQGRLELTGSLEFRGSTAASLYLEDPELVFAGTERQTLEALALDAGPPFTLYQGIAHLVVDQENQATTLQLVDDFDNDVRRGQGPEALYLTGHHFGNTLSILGGSTLRIATNTDVLSVYAIIDDRVVNLKDLFSSPNSVIEFDHGFISNELPADFNLDSTVDVLDVVLLETALRDGSQQQTYDVNGDDVVDGNDLEHLVLNILQAGPGDWNVDGRVDLADLNRIRNAFGGAGMWTAGDGTFDGFVGLDDLNLVRNNFGFQADSHRITVPEPSSCAFVTAVVWTTGVVGRRRRGVPHTGR